MPKLGMPFEKVKFASYIIFRIYQLKREKYHHDESLFTENLR